MRHGKEPERPPEAQEAPAQPETDYTPAPEVYGPPPSVPGPQVGRGGRWGLAGVAAAVALVLVAGAFFGLGYWAGNSGGETPVKGNLRQRAAQQFQQGRQKAGIDPAERVERLKQNLQKRGADLLEGTVASIAGDTLTIETPEGTQTIALTQDTRYPGAGAQAGAGAGTVSAGEKVFVVVRKSADGKLEAIAVRVPKAQEKPQTAV